MYILSIFHLPPALGAAYQKSCNVFFVGKQGYVKFQPLTCFLQPAIKCIFMRLPYSYKFSRGQIFAHFRAEVQFARNCAKISIEFLKFFASAQKFLNFIY